MNSTSRNNIDLPADSELPAVTYSSCGKSHQPTLRARKASVEVMLQEFAGAVNPGYLGDPKMSAIRILAQVPVLGVRLCGQALVTTTYCSLIGRLIGDTGFKVMTGARAAGHDVTQLDYVRPPSRVGHLSALDCLNAVIGHAGMIATGQRNDTSCSYQGALNALMDLLHLLEGPDLAHCIVISEELKMSQQAVKIQHFA